MLVDAVTGILSWTPTNLDIHAEPHAFTIRVTDERGAWAEKAFHVRVALEADNGPPEIISAPSLHAVADFSWQYAARAVGSPGAERDTLVWSLTQGPQGMAMDALSGVLTWKPALAQTGIHEVSIMVQDTLGAGSMQSFAITVQAANLPPMISSTPPTRGRAGQGWSYAMAASDPDGGALAFSIEYGPPGLVIDPATGLAAFTPDAPGVYAIGLRMTDDRGASASQRFEAVVDDAAENLPPEFRSTPVFLAQTDREYIYKVDAFDPDGQALAHSLRSSPAGMAIDANTGLLTWTPSSGDAGVHQIEIMVSDGSAAVLQSYTLTVRPNHPPAMPALADRVMVAGTVFQMTATAHDPDGDDADMLEYRLEGAPAGMAVDRHGRIGWMSGVADAGRVFHFEGYGAFEAAATATDAAGNVGAASLILQVANPLDARPPEALFHNLADNAVLSEGQEVLASVTDPDSDAVAWALTLRSFDTGQSQTLAAGDGMFTGQPVAFLDPSTLANGAYVLTLEATDEAGHRSQATRRFTVKSKYKLGNFSLSFEDIATHVGGLPVDIIRAYDTLQAHVKGDFGYGWSMSFAAAKLGVDIDPGPRPDWTLDLSLAYKHGTRLTVTLPGGRTASFRAEPEYMAQGGFAGLTAGLLGQGAAMYAMTFVCEDDSGATLSQTTYYSYDARGNLLKTIDPFGGVTENRYDASGRLTAVVDAAGNRTAYTYDAQGNPSRITRTTADGVSQELASVSYDSRGHVSRMTDLSGNVTAFAYDAQGNQILSEQQIQDGDQTHIIRTHTVYDAEGRVLSARREVDGIVKSVNMTRFGAGGLAAATVAVQGAAAAALPLHASFELAATFGLVTEYDYDIRGLQIESRSQAMDTDGTLKWLVSRTVYDAAGRAVWQTESFLKGTAHESVKATHTVYDTLGQVIRTENRTGVVIAMETVNGFLAMAVRDSGTVATYSEQAYDAAGRILWTRALSLPGDLGPVTLYFYTPEGALEYTALDWDGDRSTTGDQTVTGKTLYDEYGRQAASLVDRDGDLSTAGDQALTRFVYVERGRAVQTIFPDGSTVFTGYNQQGQKVSETDQLGQITRFEYDGMGRLAAVILPAIALNPAAAELYGRAEGERVNVRYEYAYDAWGNQTLIRDNVYAAADGTIHRGKARETVFAYDWQGRQLSRTLPLGQTETFHYDDDGQLIRQTDLDGRVTVYVYDTRLGAEGRLSEKRFYESEAALASAPSAPAQTIAYTYDLWGRVITTSDSLGATTVNEYDADGQLASVKTVLPQAGLYAGRALNTIHYEYCGLTGQVSRAWTTNSDGQVVTETVNSYDRLGRLASVEATRREGVAVSEVTDYLYTALGNLDRVLTRANPGDNSGLATQYVYDEQSRLTEVIHYLAENVTAQQLEDNPVLMHTVYTLLANGFRSREASSGSDGQYRQYDWTYDSMGRLLGEIYYGYGGDGGNGAGGGGMGAGGIEGYSGSYYYDLVGNHLQKHIASGTPAKFHDRDNPHTPYKPYDPSDLNDTYDGRDLYRKITAIFDENDRILAQTIAVNGEVTETTEHHWGKDNQGTSQTGQTVTAAVTGAITHTDMEYNLQGRLSKLAITTTDGAGTVVSRVAQEYLYDDSGIKIRQTKL